MRSAKIIVGLSLLLVLSSAQAGLAEGVAAIGKGDFKVAWMELQPLAEQGNADAQFNLGLMYFNGTGVAQDDQAALKWFRLAADQGHAFAQFALGNLYFMGRGVPKNFVASYALGNLSSSEVPPGFNQPAQMRDASAAQLTAEQVQAGQSLTRAMRDGSLTQALDAYLQSAQ